MIIKPTLDEAPVHFINGSVTLCVTSLFINYDARRSIAKHLRKVNSHSVGALTFDKFIAIEHQCFTSLTNIYRQLGKFIKYLCSIVVHLSNIRPI